MSHTKISQWNSWPSSTADTWSVTPRSTGVCNTQYNDEHLLGKSCWNTGTSMDILGHLQQGADTCTTPTSFLSLGSLFFTLPVCKLSPLIFTPWACGLSSSSSKSVVSLWPLPTTYIQLPSLRMTSGLGYGDKGSLQVSRCTTASSPPPPSN